MQSQPSQAFKIIEGDVTEVLKTLPANFFDAVLSDPPYGISFMGKEWDRGVPSSSTYKELARVLKPGAFGLHFGGTRMWHRLAVNLEDAGFELRDTVMWLYGSGFPKSHNISKALDKAAGAEREVVGRNPNSRENCDKSSTLYESGTVGKTAYVTAPATEAAKQWEGYGTAIKPAVEPALLVQKPFQSGAYTYQALQFLTNQEALWLNSTAPTAQSNSMSSQATSDGANTAQWPAESSTNTPGDLSAATDMCQSKLTENTYLNTVSLWKRILAAALNAMNTSTTETAISKTIDWKTLWFYLSQTTPESIAHSVNPKPGQAPSADVAGLFLTDAFKKLNDTLLLIAHENAMSSTHAQQKAACSTDWEPALLVQKPLDKTFANNALAWGNGGLNIDGCRVPREEGDSSGWSSSGSKAGANVAMSGPNYAREAKPDNATGRFPANIILDEEAGQALDEQSGTRPAGNFPTARGVSHIGFASGQATEGGARKLTDKGGASRFFYCAKVSSRERNAGLGNEFEEDQMYGEDGATFNGLSNTRNPSKNFHPTLKPIALTEYLAKLLLVPDRKPTRDIYGNEVKTPRRILVPFSGAGSEMIGCLKAGWDEVWGIEIDDEYVGIAKARITNHCPTAAPLKELDKAA